MSYVVLARKYRPRRLDEVVGQESIARTLRNAITSDHVAHAYLFTGPRGVGKTSMARILAMCLNCDRGPTPDPCGECPSCQRVFAGDDVDVLEIDGASNTGVDNIRDLRSNAAYVPSHSRFKIYIIDEVHMLSTGAFNALLKTLEEPPAHVKFIFATTEPHKVPETIQSRCQRFDFHNISTEHIVRRLADICSSENVRADQEALHAVARRARGAMRDSQSLLDQLIAYSPREISLQTLAEVLGQPLDQQTLDLLEIIARRDAASALSLVDSVADTGEDLGQFLQEVQEQLRNLMIILATGSSELLNDLPAEQRDRLTALAGRFSLQSALYMLSVITEASRRVRTWAERRILVELACVKLATMEDMSTLEEILTRLDSPGARPALSGPAQSSPVSEPATSQSSSLPSNPKVTAAQSSTPPQQPSDGPAGQVAQVWEDVLSRLKTSRQHSLAAFLRDALIRDFSDSVVTISFADGFGFHRQQVQDPNNLKLIESALGESLGRTVRLRVVAEDAGAGGPVVSPAKPASTPHASGKSEEQRTQAGRDPLVRKATELFRGRVIDVES